MGCPQRGKVTCGCRVLQGGGIVGLPGQVSQRDLQCLGKCELRTALVERSCSRLDLRDVPLSQTSQIRKHALAEITLEPPTADPYSDMVQCGAGFSPVRNHGMTIRQRLGSDYQAQSSVE